MKILVAFFLPLLLAAHSADFVWDGGEPQAQLERLSAAQGLRVMWWNLEDGSVNRQLESHPLDKNLQNFMKSPLRPQVLAFAEFTTHSLSPETLAALREIYPYYLFQKYNDALEDEGIAVFSQTEMSFENLGYLDWTPPSLKSEQEKSNYRSQWQDKSDYFTRPLVCLKMMRQGQAVYLLPVHLLDPWRQIRKKEGVIKTANEVLEGKDNPLWYQLQNFEILLHHRFGGDLRAAPKFLVFGDFNTPRGVAIQTVGYKLLTQDLKDIMVNHSKTFPANSAVEKKNFPSIEIDHGFTSGRWKVNAAEILPLQGSDHYALYFVMDF